MTTTNKAGTVVVDHVIGDHGQLNVRVASAELRVAAVDGDRVVVRTPDGRSLSDRVVVETTDDGVTIREREPGGLGFIRGQRVVQLEIDVPPMAEVAIETASGWLDAVGLVGEQRYRAISGDIRLRDGAGLIELTTVSGEVTIELVGATDLAIKSVSGDARVSGGHLDGLRIATTSGDIRVDSPLVGPSNKIETLSGDVEIATAAGMRVEARTVSGDLMSDLPHRSEGRMGRRTLIVGDGEIELTFRSVSGDLRIHDGSDRPMGAIPPLPPLPPLAPFSVDLPEMPEMPEMPDLGGLTLPDLDLPGFERRARRDDPTPPADASAKGDEQSAATDPVETERMAILRALEQGELDVPTAMDRLAALDGAGGPDVAREAGDD
jgi:hypothetical protein